MKDKTEGDRVLLIFIRKKQRIVSWKRLVKLTDRATQRNKKEATNYLYQEQNRRHYGGVCRE